MALPPPAAAASRLAKLFFFSSSSSTFLVQVERFFCKLCSSQTSPTHTTTCSTSVAGWLRHGQEDLHSFSLLGLPPQASYLLATSTPSRGYEISWQIYGLRDSDMILWKKASSTSFNRVNIDSNRASSCECNIHPLSSPSHTTATYKTVPDAPFMSNRAIPVKRRRTLHHI